MTIEVTNETKIDFEVAHKQLGDGPMRFAPTGERSIAEQIAALTEAEKQCFDNLKAKWEKTYEPFSDEMYLRFARCSPGKEKFNEKTAFKVMKSFPRRYLELNATDLEKQLATKVINVFPFSLLESYNHFLNSCSTTTTDRHSIRCLVCRQKTVTTYFSCILPDTFPRKHLQRPLLIISATVWKLW
jgi:hypothetical protein